MFTRKVSLSIPFNVEINKIMQRPSPTSMVVRYDSRRANPIIRIKKPDDKPRELKQWRPAYKDAQSALSFFNKNNPEDGAKGILGFAPKSFNPWDIMDYFRQKKLEKKWESQIYHEKRHATLGNDLATAHFLIYRGGKVRFSGSTEWTTLNPDGLTVDLPTTFDPRYKLAELDASGVELFTESLPNFSDLDCLKVAKFARSPHFDNWFLDALVLQFPVLEYLDVSECPNLDEFGLVALYKCPTLQTLVVTNFYDSPAFELTCLMLEDVLPNLQCKILKPDTQQLDSVQDDIKKLSDKPEQNLLETK